MQKTTAGALYARRRRHSKGSCWRATKVCLLVLLVGVAVGGRVFWGYRGLGADAGDSIKGRNGDGWFSAGREDVLVRMEARKDRAGAKQRPVLIDDDYAMEGDYDYDSEDEDDDDGGGGGDSDRGGDDGRGGEAGWDQGEQRAKSQKTMGGPPPSFPPPRAKHQRPACKIHVLDPTASVCNITDVWPFDHPGRGMVGMSRTPHQHAPHAAGYWLASAVRNSKKYYEEDMDKADLVLVDTHCFESQYAAVMGGGSADGPNAVVISEREKEQVSMAISRVFVDAVTNTNAYVKSKGKKFVVVRPTLGAPPGSMLDSCAKLKSVFFVGSERGIFCDNDRDRAWKGGSVLLPPVTNGYELELAGKTDEPMSIEDRDVMFYLRLPCYRHLPRSPNTIFLESIEERLQKSWDLLRQGFNASDSSQVVIDTSDDGRCAGTTVDHTEGVEARKRNLEIMSRSRYCAILAPGDRQSSVELGLAVRRGCIPVFLGPPFHSMPMASSKASGVGSGDDMIGIAYADFAIFVHVVDHTRSMWAFDEVSLSDGDLEPDGEILNSPVEVPDIIDAIRYVQNVPATVVSGLHAGVLGVRDLFMYGNEDGPRGAVDVALDSMCSYWSRMKMDEALKKKEREEKQKREEEKEQEEKKEKKARGTKPAEQMPRANP